MTNSAAPQSTTAKHSGSDVIAALEAAWAAIQANHPDLPDAMMITGSGAAGGEWGHTWHDRWSEGNLPTDDELRAGGGVTMATETRKTEIFIAGERLACGAKLTFQTMLHEAAHVLAHERGVQDTSNRGRYHNRVFVKIATELGLCWPEGEKALPVIGFSAVVIRDETVEKYADVIDGLHTAIKLYLALPYDMGGAAVGTTGGTTVTVLPTMPKIGRPKTKPGTNGGNNPLAQCQCDEPRKIRLSRKMLALGGIVCKICGEEFAIVDADDEEI